MKTFKEYNLIDKTTGNPVVFAIPTRELAREEKNWLKDMVGQDVKIQQVTFTKTDERIVR